VLEPEVVVLHYTCSSTYPGVHALFDSDTPNLNELPGVVAHFVVDKDGTIYQQLPLDKRGRHTVGLNHVAIGIEVVQEAGSGDADACGEIMSRKKQIRALVDLMRWLMYRYDIPLMNVVGHGTANASPYFKDLQGWSNSHVDWSSAQIKKFRELLREDGR
jgi:N-acetyl-anhydromuramyl-L-alanine amidase AmpD